jgi:hypothetical protein
MTFATFSTCLVVGSALTGLWLAVRLVRLTPKTFLGATTLLASTIAFAAIAPVLLRFTVVRLPLAAALMLGAFPVLVAIFTSSMLVLRYFVVSLGTRSL